MNIYLYEIELPVPQAITCIFIEKILLCMKYLVEGYNVLFHKDIYP